MKRLAIALAALVVLAGGVAGASTTPSGGSSASGCPSPERCRLYKLGPERWPAKRGAVTIRYRINATQPWVLPGQASDAIKAAARTWEMANPAVHLVFDGMTTDPPQLGDNVNEIAWAANLDSSAVAQTNYRDKGTKRLEADTLLNMSSIWGWTPCDQRSRSCTDTASSAPSVKRIDVQAVLTHEFGHWLGLESLSGATAAELTMFNLVRYGERKQNTLGMGDMAAVRVAYPCRGCRMPAIYTP